jgi:hypothetical protein
VWENEKTVLQNGQNKMEALQALQTGLTGSLAFR